jgi:PBSX family phage terminase large subunit
MTDKRIELYDHQLKIMEVPVIEKHSRYGMLGGVGSGKTYVMMLKMVSHLLKYPGTNGMLLARVKNDLKMKNYPDFVDAFGEYIKHEDRQNLIVTLKNGSKVFFVHGWDDERGVKHLDGYNCSCFLMSQAEEMPEKTYRKMVDRNRKMDRGEKEWVELFEGNPAGKNWIWDLFCKDTEKQEFMEEVNGHQVAYDYYYKKDVTISNKKEIFTDSFFISCQSENYDFVPEGYLETLLKNSSERYKMRYVFGKFDNFTGMVYDCWNPKIFSVNPYDIPIDIDRERYARVLWFDWGHRVPSAAIWGLYDRHEDSYVLYRLHYQAGWSAEMQAQNILEKTGKELVDICIADTQIWNVDPATGQSLILDFQKVWPWPIVPADKRVEAGIERTYKYISAGKILVFKNMKEFFDEIDGYRFVDDDEIREPKKNLSEAPLKKKDHLMDCLRYGVMGRIFYDRPNIDLTKTNRKVSVPYEYGESEKQILRTEVE